MVKIYTVQFLYGQNLYDHFLSGQNLYISKFTLFKFIKFKVYTVQYFYGKFLYSTNFIQSQKHPLWVLYILHVLAWGSVFFLTSF
jgi:hypothetical protein